MDKPEMPDFQTLISDDDVVETVEMGKKIAYSQLQDGEITPHVIIAMRAKEDRRKLIKAMVCLVIGEEWGEYDYRAKIMQGLALKMLEDGYLPMAIVMVTEVWTAAQEDCDGMPSESPNRKEAILVSALTIDGRSRGELAPIMDHNEDGLAILDWESTENMEHFLLSEFFRAMGARLNTEFKNGRSDGTQDFNQN